MQSMDSPALRNVSKHNNTSVAVSTMYSKNSYCHGLLNIFFFLPLIVNTIVPLNSTLLLQNRLMVRLGIEGLFHSLLKNIYFFCSTWSTCDLP